MPHPDHPTVDTTFLSDQIRGHCELAGDFAVGSTYNFIIVGNQPIHKRLIYFREIEPGQVGLEQSTAIALRLGFLGILMTWLEENRQWKEGGYIE